MVVTSEILFYTKYMQEAFNFILSIRRKQPELYWVYSGCLQFHTEYVQEVSIFILSIRMRAPGTRQNSSSETCWAYTRILHVHTEYAHEAFHITLSMHRMSPFLYWVYAGCCLFHTEYMQESYILDPVWNERSSINLCQVQSILSMFKEISCVLSVWKRRCPAYTQYENGDVLRILSIRMIIPPPMHPIDPIEDIFVSGGPFDQIYSLNSKKCKSMTSEILCQCKDDSRRICRASPPSNQQLIWAVTPCCKQCEEFQLPAVNNSVESKFEYEHLFKYNAEIDLFLYI